MDYASFVQVSATGKKTRVNFRFVQEIVQMHVEIQWRMQEDAALLPDRVS